ncbi:P-loop containing nucleoside triphosphate hydrolase protein [Fennellomyces sp. T-0311]|nr:P-loop containing nucleoside triphosphate hydrolase protein [Fennellomyces sp. T-0311]
MIVGTTPQPVHPWNLGEQVCCEGHKVPVSPEASASIFSWAVFQWVNPLVRYGFSNAITRDDLYTLTYQHRARFAHASFTKASKNSIRILYSLYKANQRSIWIQVIFSNAAVLLSYCNPYLQQLFLEYIEKKDSPIHVAYGYVFVMFLAAIARTLCSSIQLWVGRRWNIRTLCMLDAEIYAKALRRKGACVAVAQDESGNDNQADNNSTGKITNLMSLDADHIADLPAYIYMFYNGPVEMTIAMVYLYYLLGTAALVGLGVLVLFFPITYCLVKWVRKAYFQLSQAEDRRNHLVNELLQGIRIIKYAAWESNWQKKIMAARIKELQQIRRTFILDIIMSVGYMTMPVLVSACSFIWYVKDVISQKHISVVFVSITLFDMLRSPVMLIPDAISAFTEAYVSLKRISSYLEDAEVDEPSSQESTSPRVGFEASIFQWPSASTTNNSSQNTACDQDKTERDPLLPNSERSTQQYATISTPIFQLRIPSAFDFPPGQLSLIYGPTGSGKSSILHALLGEMDKVKGQAYLPLTGFSRKLLCDAWSMEDDNDKDEEQTLYDGVSPTMSNLVAYAAQQPFLRQATIRENILFGNPYEAERYRKVLWQCALVKDLSILPNGDQTEIGEKGISLSGGQKQRVSLARAVYSYAKVALLDDCLSAVDAHTARHIFEHCIRGSLLQGRTVVMVTHHLQLCISAAKFLVRLEMGGVVAEYGLVENLRQTDEFSEILKSSIHTNTTQTLETKGHDGDNNIIIEEKEATATAKLIQDEQTEKGHVKIKVHLAYFRACGGWLFWTALAIFFCASRSLVFAENWWLRIWAAAYSSSNTSHTPYSIHPTSHYQAFSFTDIRLQVSQYATSVQGFKQGAMVDVNYYITVYVFLCLSFVVCDALRNILLFWGSIRGAKALFSQLLDRITHAPLRFFDTTPCGRILNRFGSDMTVIDMQMARTAGLLIECLTGMVASSLIISAITPQFILVAAVTAVTYMVIGVYYLRSSRELKRLNSVNRSPIYSHFTETLSGVTTIRAFGQQRKFLSAMYEKIDSYLSPYYLLWMVNRWLLIRMESAGALMSLGAGILILHNLDTVDAGMAGISLVYARTFLVHVYWMIRQYTQVEINMNSVERIQEYLELDQEPRNQLPVPQTWPEKATLSIRNLHIRYAPDLDPVLHGVSFDVRDKEKIGIVGRTGSGKSTFALSLFRFLEASEGDIILDGLNIANIDLKSLRSRLTMIPQDAALFSGTIRSNLDPFDEHSDESIWTALARVHIRSMIQSLDQPVSDGGQNFSQGQRQLLCMSRALLRSSKLIVMDEATASVDFEIDAKIQRTIRQAFADSTLICVAHRLRTVIDYDRVLVMDQGRVIEFDSPWRLLNRTPTSAFHAMCEQSGELPILLEMARQAEAARERDSPLS